MNIPAVLEDEYDLDLSGSKDEEQAKQRLISQLLCSLPAVDIS
jgi:hypothetical protein